MPKVKIGNRLVEVSKEALDGMTPLRPQTITPVGGAMEGANPDEAKMKGTPNQTRAGIRQAVRGESLQAFRRLDHKQGQAADERAKQRFDSLARVDEALASRIEKELAAQQIKTNRQAFKIDWEVLGGPPTDEKAQARFEQLAAKVLNQEPLTGKESDEYEGFLNNLQLNESALASAIEGTEESLRRQLKQNKPEEFKLELLTDEDFTEYGIDEEELRLMLGDDWKTKSLKELQTQIKERQANFADVSQLQQIITNPFASISLQTEARKRLRELGYADVLSTAQDTKDLQTMIADGDVINIGGTQFSIEEIVEDDRYLEEMVTLAQSPESIQALLNSDDENQRQLGQFLQQTSKELQKEYAIIMELYGDEGLTTYSVDTGQAEGVTVPAALFRKVPAESELFSAINGMAKWDQTRGYALADQMRTMNEELFNEFISLSSKEIREIVRSGKTVEELNTEFTNRKTAMELLGKGDIQGMITSVLGTEHGEAFKAFSEQFPGGLKVDSFALYEVMGGKQKRPTTLWDRMRVARGFNKKFDKNNDGTIDTKEMFEGLLANTGLGDDVLKKLGDASSRLGNLADHKVNIAKANKAAEEARLKKGEEETRAKANWEPIIKTKQEEVQRLDGLLTTREAELQKSQTTISNLNSSKKTLEDKIKQYEAQLKTSNSKTQSGARSHLKIQLNNAKTQLKTVQSALLAESKTQQSIIDSITAITEKRTQASKSLGDAKSELRKVIPDYKF